MQSNGQPDSNNTTATSLTDSRQSGPAVDPSSDPALGVPKENTQTADASAPLNRLHGIAAYFCALLFFEFLLLGILSSDPHEIIVLAAGGLITGQLAFTAIATSLMSKNWVEGVLIGAAGLLCIFIAAWLPTSFRAVWRPSLFLFAFSLPATCLIATSPLICMRWWFGWRLTLAKDKLYAPSRLCIEDMILVPCAIAAMFVAGNLSNAIGDPLPMTPDLSGLLFVSLPALVVCLVMVTPATYWFFRGADLAAGWAASAGYLVACFFVLLFLVIAISNGQVPPAFLGWLIGFFSIASLIGLLGLQVIRASGYRLKRFASAVDSLQPAANGTGVSSAPLTEPRSTATPFDLDILDDTYSEEELFERKRRIRFRITVGALVVVSALLNVCSWRLSRNRLDRIMANIAADGGVFESTADRITSIDFGPENVDTHMRELPPIETLREIKLNRAPDAELWQLRKFPGLQSLDLRNTNCDSQMLPSSVPRGVKIIMWQDQLSKEAFEELRRYGFTVEQIAR